MTAIIRTRAAAVLAGSLGAAALGLSVGSGSALAADPPPEGCVDSEVVASATVKAAVEDLDLPESTPDAEWDWRGADSDTLDECAELSAVVVTVEDATASSPHHVLLFHGAKYLGTATAEPYAYEPEVEVVDEDTIDVTYSYLEDDEPNAAPQGRAEASFSWDHTDSSVIMNGEVPPAR